MQMEWVPPSKGAALNTASGVLGLAATRDQFIGWGPYLASSWARISDHPVEVLALIIAVGLLAYAHWQWVLGIVGFHAKPSAKWPTDKELGDEILAWLRKRASITDNTRQMSQKANGAVDISFSFTIADERPVTILKVANSQGIQLSARIQPSAEHARAIEGMEDAERKAMQDDVQLELVKFGIPIVATGHLAELTGEADGGDGGFGVLIGSALRVQQLSEADFVEQIDRVRRAIVVAQVLLRKHIRLASDRRGQPAPPAEDAIPPALATVPAATSTPPVPNTSEPQPSQGE